MAKEFTRSDRLASQFQRELAELLRTDIRDPHLGMVTLSEVEVSRDLSLIKAFVSFLGGDETPRQCVKALNEHAPKLRRALSGRVRVRVMPELRFVHDDSIERGLSMDRLLDSLKQSSPDGHSAGEEDETP